MLRLRRRTQVCNKSPSVLKSSRVSELRCNARTDDGRGLTTPLPPPPSTLKHSAARLRTQLLRTALVHSPNHFGAVLWLWLGVCCMSRKCHLECVVHEPS